MKKKLTALALVVVMVAMLFTGLTMAYFTDTEDATNVFTVGDIDIELTEPKWDPDNDGADDKDQDGKDDVLENIVPGVTYAKDPTIKNIGDNPAWVRVKVSFPGYKWSNVIFSGSRVTPEQFLVDFNDDHFNVTLVPGNDEYTIVMESKEALNPEGYLVAFKGIEIPTEIDEDYFKNAYGTTEDNYEFKVVVTAEAIQAQGFDTADDAFAALDAQ